MKVFVIALALVLGSALWMAPAHGAFIVEADNVAPVGKANDHFTSTGHSLSSTPSTALGLSGNQSAFGSNAATTPDVYTIRYTPGVDVDNTVFAAGIPLGNSSATDADGLGAGAPVYVTAPQLATGLTGGASGLYNVYFTAPASTNVDASGSQFLIASDLGPVALNPVNVNSGNTGPDEDPAPGHQGGANNHWLKIGSVALTAGTQYTVVMTSNSSASVSQRAHGVMWELVVPIPEPATMTLFGLGLVGCICAARRRAG